MARSRADVLTVLALARRGGLVEDGQVPLDIAPLFETVDDLRQGPDTLRDLLADPVYRQHLAARGNVQMVMLGYSDSGKDGGIAASRWGLQRAQVELMQAAEELGIKLTFFHGRGGSLSRGGSKTSRAVDASPRGSVDGRLRMTEQGEAIHRKFGIRALALRSLEQATGAVLVSSIRPRAPEPREAKWREVMDTVAQASSLAYRGFVGAPRFMDYFRSATPIDVIERMTLGSRPSRRLGQDAALSNLRAIPWVFAWSQARAVIDGLQAQVVTLALAGDIDKIAAASAGVSDAASPNTPRATSPQHPSSVNDATSLRSDPKSTLRCSSNGVASTPQSPLSRRPVMLGLPVSRRRVRRWPRQKSPPGTGRCEARRCGHGC